MTRLRAADLARRHGGVATGRGYLIRCPCPAHGRGRGDRNPSLYIEDGLTRLLVSCFAGCEAVDVLKALPDAPARAEAPSAPLPPATTTQTARRLWSLGKPLAGSPVADYLARRGLTPPYPSSLRYLPPSERYPRPTMIAAITDDANRIAAAHLTYLDLDQPWRPGAHVERRVIGPAIGGAVRIGRIEGDTAGVAEGIENGWAAFLLFSVPTLAVTAAKRVPALRLPATIRRLVFFGDPDKPGRRARDLLAEAHPEIEIEDRFAPDRSDWNLELLRLARAG